MADKKMPKEEISALIGGMINTAVQYTDSQLSPHRAKATRYYKGEKFGNEEDGRSKVVMTEVRDSVLGVLPTVLETFFGPERPVEFVPKREDSIEQAEQATDYIYNVFTEENPGFLETYSVLKDGLVRRLGVFKWWWEKDAKKAYRMEGIAEDVLQSLYADPEIEIVGVEQREDGLFNCDLSRTEKEGHASVKAVPPEEFIVDPEAVSLEDAIFVGHRTEKTRSELVAMGYAESDIDEAIERESTLLGNVERLERRPNTPDMTKMEGGKANRKVAYCETFPYLDVDGDGIAELRRICTIGSRNHVVLNEPASERPFAPYVPDPEPHTLEGLGWSDRTMDLQEINSSLVRAGLDGLSSSLFPQVAYQEGMVNPLDLMNKEVGSRIRTRGRPSDVMQEFRTSFDVAGVSGMLDYFDKVKTARTGQQNGAAALDTDALQSSTQIAVAAQVSAMKAQARMLSRVFAEMTFKPLFRGLLRLLIQHQPKAKIARLRGKWVQVDPRSWDANMDVTVNVAIGSDGPEAKLQAISGVLAKQEMILQTMGVNNPVVSPVEYRNALAKGAELSGLKGVSAFFKPLDETALAEWQQSQAEPPPSPEMLLAQAQIEVERMRAEKDTDLAEAREMREHRKLQLEDDRERDKLAAEIALKEKEMELKYSTELSKEQLRADIARERQTSAGSGDTG